MPDPAAGGKGPGGQEEPATGRQTIELEIPQPPPSRYQIVVGIALPGEVAADLLGFADPPGWAVLTDDRVAPRFAEPLAAALRDGGATSECFSFPAGEAAKSRETVAELQDRLIGAGYGRDAWVVAVGGGVVGDVAGYVAATLYRGIPYVQVPTTLLAMVDSSVGGKTGVDTPDGKNLVGAFHQPRRVLIDVSTLAGLPAEEMAAGLAEVIKYGVILDEELFGALEDGLLEACMEGSLDDLVELVARCCRLKAAVVTADEREADTRQILNFGHTVAHAVEAVLGYRIRHGEAVAVGMVAEAHLAARLAGAPEAMAERIAGLCRRAGLPTRLPAGCDPAAVVAAARRDKKVRAGRLRCVLPEAIGRVTGAKGGITFSVPTELLAEILEEGSP